jgi:hypothetical protein
VSAGELAVVLAAVLCALGFAALVVVLYRVLDAMRELRDELGRLRRDTEPSTMPATTSTGSTCSSARPSRSPRT